MQSPLVGLFPKELCGLGPQMSFLHGLYTSMRHVDISSKQDGNPQKESGASRVIGSASGPRSRRVFSKICGGRVGSWPRTQWRCANGDCVASALEGSRCSSWVEVGSDSDIEIAHPPADAAEYVALFEGQSNLLEPRCLFTETGMGGARCRVANECFPQSTKSV
jgi:hypothetical protein